MYINERSTLYNKFSKKIIEVKLFIFIIIKNLVFWKILNNMKKKKKIK